nr:BTG11 [Cercospora sp. JNU001]
MSIFESLPRPTATFHNKSYQRLTQEHGFDGTGKTILVVGGTGNVGSSICKAFATTGVSRIAIVSRTFNAQVAFKEELGQLCPGTQVLTSVGSITDRTRMNEVLAELQHEVDILVICAAVAHPAVPALGLFASDLREAYETNCFAPFDLVKAFLSSKSNTPARSRTIINISSASLQVSHTRRSGYASSKAAFAQLLQHLASENALHGSDRKTKIHSFHPGAFYSPAVANHFPSDTVWDDLALPGDFAVWLAGSQSDFLHGRFVWANWDVEEMMTLKERLLRDRSFLTVGLCM